MISQQRQPSRPRFRPKVQARGRVYRFPEVRSLDEKRAVESRVRETLKRNGAVEATSITRVHHELDLDSLNDRVIAPEKRLMLRVLAQASKDLVANGSPKLLVETREWLQSEDRCHAMTFASICDALGRDPESVRLRFLGRAVETWRARAASARPRDDKHMEG